MNPIKPYSLKEAFIIIHNEIMLRKAREIIDSMFYAEKAKKYGPRTPERTNFENEAKQNAMNVFWSDFLLNVIKKLIKAER